MNRVNLRLVTAGACCLALIGAAGTLTGCKGGEKTESAATPAKKALWDRLGGEPAVTAVVDDFVARAAGDDANVNFFRKNVAGYPEWKPTDAQVATLKRRLVEFISAASGGPLKYTGKDMKSAHAGMKITQAQFNALAGHLAASLDKFKVPAQEKGELLGAVAGTAPQMVEIK